LCEQDSQGAIVYFSQKRRSWILDPYFIYKHDDKVLANGQQAEIYTFGFRATGTLSDRWSAVTDVAPQFGHKDGTSLHTLGARARLNYTSQDAWDSQWHLGYEYRGGADRQDGCFDMLWGRHGRNWADLNGCLGSLESQKHRLTNLHRIGAGWQGQCTADLTLSCTYHLLLRDRNLHAGTPGFSSHGHLRGHMVVSTLSYTFSKSLSGYLSGEIFFPGNYYESPHDDRAFFVGWHVLWTW
jgi:hypothetical protein